MAGTPITNTDYIKSYTYYGNGCPNIWDSNNPPYYGGSQVSCSIRTVGPSNGEFEEQDIGTYYSYISAIADPDSLDYELNEVAPDSFCPLGWQMPYGGSGGDYYDKSKSWKYLLDTYNLSISEDGKYNGLVFRNYPFNIIMSGHFYGGSWSGLFRTTNAGIYWSNTSKAATNAFRIYVWYDKLTTLDESAKNGMNTVRCDRRISILKSSPWHPRSLISIMAFHFLKAHFPSVKIMSNYLKNETKYFIFKELRANFDEAESKYKMENRILMSE